MARLLLYVMVMLAAAGPAWAQGAVPLTWTEALREAAENHPDLIAAKENIVQSREDKNIVLSGALPQLSAFLNASANQAENSGSSNSFSYGVEGSQLIFDGFRTLNNISAARQGVNVAREGFKFTSSQVRLRLRQAFIDLLKAQQAIDLSQDIYKLRKSDLELISLRYQSGTEHRGALLTAKANLKEASYDINQSSRDLAVAQRRLAKEMGRRETDPVQVQGDFTVSQIVEQEPDFEEIAKDNPSLLQVAAQENVAALNIKASQGAYAPEIAATGDLGKSGNRWPPSDDGSSVGVRVSVPIFSGGANAAQLNKSRSIYRQLQQQERSTKDAVIVALQQNWSALQDAVEAVSVQQSFLEAAQERAKIAEQQYSVGLISYDNWTIIGDDLVRAKKTFLDAQANALTAEANWIAAKGETVEP